MVVEELKLKITAEVEDFKKKATEATKKTKDIGNAAEDAAKKTKKSADIGGQAADKTVTGVTKIKKILTKLSDDAIKKVTGNMGEMGVAATETMSGLSTGAVAAAGAVAAVVVATVALAKKVIDISNEVSALGDKIDKTSQKLNMSYSTYQKWDYLMNLCGSSAEDLKEGMNQMMTQMNSAKSGDATAQGYFKKLGVSVTDASGQLRDSNTVFSESISSLQRMENRTERAALAQRLFGENASKLAPLFNMSAAQMKNAARSAEVLGLAMNDGLVSTSAKYTDTVYTFQQSWQSLKNTIGESVLPALQGVVKWAIKAVTYINIIFRAILGLKQATSTTNKLATATNSYASGLTKAATAAAALKRQTFGFDQMNVMQSTSSGASGANVSGLSDMDFSGAQAGFDSMFSEEELNKIEKFREKIENATDKIHKFALGISGAGMVIMGMVTLNIPLMILGLKNLMEAFGVDPQKVWEDIKNWWNTKVKPIFTQKWWDDHLWFPIKEWFDKTREKIGMSTYVVSWQDICNWWNTKVKPIFTQNWWNQNVWFPIRDWWNGLPIVQKAKSVWSDIQVWWNTRVKPVFTQNWWNLNVWYPIRDWFSNLPIVKKVRETWESVKSFWNSNIGKVFTAKFWSDKWVSIKQGFKDGINSVIAAIESGINGAIGKLNGLGFTLPNWMGGDHFGFNFRPISLPRLATGGIATRSTIANIGEAGHEAILPLENNTGWMDVLADKLAERQGSPSTIILAVDDRELGRASIKGINKVTKQTGKLQLIIS